MARSSAVTNALREARQNILLKQEDHSHLDRWDKQARESVWTDLADAITEFGESWTLSAVIYVALWARNQAEFYETFDPKKERDKEEQSKRKLLALASQMEELAKAYLACEIAQVPELGPPPEGVDCDLAAFDPDATLRTQSLAWLQKDALRIRELAKEGPVARSDVSGSNVRVTRQSKGPKRSNYRVIKVFVQHMLACMKVVTGKPRWHTVAALAEVAFPPEDSEEPLSDEDVRQLCKPTTRTGRRKKPVHSNVKSDKKPL
jgi:hypothetical protein